MNGQADFQEELDVEKLKAEVNISDYYMVGVLERICQLMPQECVESPVDIIGDVCDYIKELKAEVRDLKGDVRDMEQLDIEYRDAYGQSQEEVEQLKHSVCDVSHALIKCEDEIKELKEENKEQMGVIQKLGETIHELLPNDSHQADKYMDIAYGEDNDPLELELLNGDIVFVDKLTEKSRETLKKQQEA
jgi:chromosome segregation ATPase